MFLPFETSFSMWFAAMPQYEWVPAPPPPADTCVGVVGAASESTPVPMTLVFQRIDWSAFPVWQAQANPAWEIVAQNRCDEADAVAQERARHARRALPEAPPAATEMLQRTGCHWDLPYVNWP